MNLNVPILEDVQNFFAMQELNAIQEQDEDSLLDNEDEWCGIESMVRISKGSMNTSCMYKAIGQTFAQVIQKLSIRYGSEFLFLANSSDLWKHLLNELKQYRKNFPHDEFLIIKRSLVMSRMFILHKLVRSCEDVVGSDNPTIRKIYATIHNYKNKRSKNDISIGDFKMSILYLNFVEKGLEFLDETDKRKNRNRLFQVFQNFDFDHIHEDLFRFFMVATLHFITATLQGNSSAQNKKGTLIIYLLILYLKLQSTNYRYLDIVRSLKMTNLRMNLLGKIDGSIKIIRFFEDAPELTIKKEYQDSKKCISEKIKT